MEHWSCDLRMFNFMMTAQRTRVITGKMKIVIPMLNAPCISGIVQEHLAFLAREIKKRLKNTFEGNNRL